MKYDVTYQCGHTGVVELYGPNAERERKLAWYANGICPDCYKDAERKRIEENAAELPKLEGTEKQVDWALKIRQKFIDEIMMSKLSETDKKFLNYILAKRTSAKQWIDERDSAPNQIARQYAADFRKDNNIDTIKPT
jgi:hypothetical protein